MALGFVILWRIFGISLCSCVAFPMVASLGTLGIIKAVLGLSYGELRVHDRRSIYLTIQALAETAGSNPAISLSEACPKLI